MTRTAAEARARARRLHDDRDNLAHLLESIGMAIHRLVHVDKELQSPRSPRLAATLEGLDVALDEHERALREEIQAIDKQIHRAEAALVEAQAEAGVAP